MSGTADDLDVAVATVVAARPSGRYVTFVASADHDASATEILEFVASGGAILAATLRTAPAGGPASRAWAASKCSCTGATSRLARMFPDVAPASDTWATLRWATSRADVLPDHRQFVRCGPATFAAARRHTASGRATLLRTAHRRWMARPPAGRLLARSTPDADYGIGVPARVELHIRHQAGRGVPAPRS